MNKLIIPIMLFMYGMGISCKSTQPTLTSTPEPTPQISVGDSIYIYLEALNLSEDMSTFSSKNDEILIIIYDLSDTVSLKAPEFSAQLLLDTTQKAKVVFWKTNPSLAGKNLLFLLIEQDSETPLEQLDPIFRIHHQAIIQAYQNRDYVGMKTYLGDEDLLGVKKIAKLDLEQAIQFSFKGIHKLDKYEYHVKLSLAK